MRGTLQKRVAELRLSEMIPFVGGVGQAQLGDWYRAADLTVLPSRSEGIPNVLRESQACGTPFVASRVGGIAEIADARTDRLVPPEDPTALANAIEAFPATPRLAERVPSSMSWKSSAEALISILMGVGARPRAVKG